MPFMNRCKRKIYVLLQDCIATSEWARIHDYRYLLLGMELLPLAANGPPESLRYPTNPRKEYMKGQ